MRPVGDNHIVQIEVKDHIQKIGSVWAVEKQRKDNYDNFDPLSGIIVSGEHEGKEAFFHKLCYKQALRGENKAIIEEGDKTYMTIHGHDLYLYVKDGKIEMSKGWVLCEPDEETWDVVTAGPSVFLAKKHKSGLWLGKDDKAREDIVFAKLSHIHPEVAAELGLRPGDMVYLDKATDIPLENELNRRLDKKYFRVHIDNIIGIKCDATA